MKDKKSDKGTIDRILRQWEQKGWDYGAKYIKQQERKGDVSPDSDRVADNSGTD